MSYSWAMGWLEDGDFKRARAEDLPNDEKMFGRNARMEIPDDWPLVPDEECPGCWYIAGGDIVEYLWFVWRVPEPPAMGQSPFLDWVAEWWPRIKVLGKDPVLGLDS